MIELTQELISLCDCVCTFLNTKGKISGPFCGPWLARGPEATRPKKSASKFDWLFLEISAICLLLFEFQDLINSPVSVYSVRIKGYVRLMLMRSYDIKMRNVVAQIITAKIVGNYFHTRRSSIRSRRRSSVGDASKHLSFKFNISF